MSITLLIIGISVTVIVLLSAGFLAGWLLRAEKDTTIHYPTTHQFYKDEIPQASGKFTNCVGFDVSELEEFARK